MFTLMIKFSFPGEMTFHQEFFFETEEELKEFSERVDNCPFTEVVKVSVVDAETYLPF